MTTIVVEIYDALRKAGADEESARAAAQAVLGAEERQQLATKADIEALDKRLSVIQWIGVIFLALNGSLIATLLWTLGIAIRQLVR